MLLLTAAQRLSIAQDRAAPAKIPAVHATSFSGIAIDLPQALQGKVGVLVLGFSQDSRKAVEAWGKGLAAAYDGAPRVAYYEMPVLASVPRLMRGFVLSRIRAAVSDPARPHFLPVLQDEAQWRTLAHYQTPDDAYVLVVDEVGTLQWKVQGPPTEAAIAALEQHVAALEGTMRAAR
jgi:hypothetical protein